MDFQSGGDGDGEGDASRIRPSGPSQQRKQGCHIHSQAEETFLQCRETERRHLCNLSRGGHSFDF